MANIAPVRPTALYPFQERDINSIFERIGKFGSGYHLLYQLPTGGGKTVIFCEIARRFIETFGQNVTILTHRKELCRQTSRTLTAAGVENRVISSNSKVLQKRECPCFVAMVETLKNRLRKNKKVHVDNVGLVIIDEAHHNSFQKVLKQFPDAFILGVSATPLSSNLDFPLNKTYNELVIGENIQSLIDQRFLAKPHTIRQAVDLQSLTTGISGDYTITSSDALYSLAGMQELLLESYRAHCENKKTLIFNAGIATSKNVEHLFSSFGYPIRHLDNRTPDKEREEILKWFKRTKGAILTSVSILTTGFDEPGIQAIILNRATTSLTLYHQMVGRGARFLTKKRIFTVVDLGNNADRFGLWNDTVDWQQAFDDPEGFTASLHTSAAHSEGRSSALTPAIRALFPNSVEIGFDMDAAFENDEISHRRIIQEAIRQHARICIENAESASRGLELAAHLDADIEFRVRKYVKYLGKGTAEYRKWLIEDYKRRLEGLVRRMAGANADDVAVD